MTTELLTKGCVPKYVVKSKYKNCGVNYLPVNDELYGDLAKLLNNIREFTQIEGIDFQRVVGSSGTSDSSGTSGSSGTSTYDTYDNYQDYRTKSLSVIDTNIITSIACLAYWVDAVFISASTSGTSSGIKREGDAYIRAYNQSAGGKGVERHANSDNWLDQPIFTVAKRHGVGFLVGQAEKKISESYRLEQLFGRDRAEEEILGAICYLSAAYIFLMKEY